MVNRIDVVGNQRVDAATIRAYLSIQLGENFTTLDEDASLKALFETGLFADVAIDARGSTLVVTVVENPVINEVAFEGNKKFKDEQLSPVVQSQPRGVFTRAKVQSDVSRILELYRRSARLQASVTPETIELPNNRVNLVFVMTEGPKTGISGITFIGNQAFGEARLRNVIETRRSSILSFIRGGDVYDPDLLSADEEKLRRYYLDRGFADFQVISSVADLDRERNTFFISFSVWKARATGSAPSPSIPASQASTQQCWSGRSRLTRAMFSPAVKLKNRSRRSRCISPRTAIRSRRRGPASTAIRIALRSA